MAMLGFPNTAESAFGLELEFRPTSRSTVVPLAAAIKRSLVSVKYGAATKRLADFRIIMVSGFMTKSLDGPFENMRFMWKSGQ